MTPLASAVVLFVIAIAVIAVFAAYLRRAATFGVAVLPDSAPAPAPTALEGALAASD